MQLRQELTLIPRQDLELEQVATGSMAALLENCSPFRKSIPRISELEVHIRRANSALYAREESRRILHADYSINQAVFTFARPLLHLPVREGLQESFISIVSHSPYLIEEPLSVFFKPAGQEDYNEFVAETILHEHLLPVSSEVLESGRLERTEKVRSKIVEAARNANGKVHTNYSFLTHAAFVGLYDICFPLFGIDRKNKEYERTTQFLRERHGTFLLPMPAYLDAQEKESS